MTPPNIILVVLDTLRADRFVINYENKCLTPFIKSLLKNSIYFENCIANSTWTLPSHISMFTGLYHNQNITISQKHGGICNKVPTLPEILKDLGYFTINYSENAFLSKKYGFTRGFDEVFSFWDRRVWFDENFKFSFFPIFLNRINTLIIEKIKNARIIIIWKKLFNFIISLFKKVVLKLFTKEIIFNLKNNTLEELESFSEILKNKNNNQPKFIFFNFLTTHDPYIPLKKYLDISNVKYKDFRNIKEIILTTLKYRFKVNLDSKIISKKKLNSLKKLYDVGVSSVDDVTRKLFEILKKIGLTKNTYVIITSDHGEHLGDNLDHYLWEHCTYLSLYEGVIKVPLLIYHSNSKQLNIKNQVQLKDLFHTILHLTGNSFSEIKYLDIKKSIIYQINNNLTPEYIFGEFCKDKKFLEKILNNRRKSLNISSIRKILNEIYFLRSNNYKYIKFDKTNIEELYALKTDPYEQNNLFDKNSEKCKEMRNYLNNYVNNMKSIDNLKEILTEKEKDNINKMISLIKL